MKMLQPLIGEHIKIELVLGENVGAVHADAGHLQQMLMNLCVNARDAMPNGGQLTIRTEDVRLTEAYCDEHLDIEPGRYLMLSVSDTGCGMPPEVRDHIFEPFFTTKEVGKGTGLGLAMVYGMMQQHRGAIHVYSEVGIGTTFRIYLPTVDHAAEPQPEPARGQAAGGTETILIAEDDPMVRELAVRILQRAGYQTIVAADGEDAVRVFQDNVDHVSLAILDAVMPRLSGRDAFQRMQQINPRLPAIFCSGYDPEMAQVDFATEEHLRLIQKPFTPQSLLANVREALDLQLCPMI
jgi:CheY-like chemotaxis protein